MADGGGGGGGGGGKQGGVGGATRGGDDGAFSGADGADLIPAGGNAGSANNNGGVASGGGDGYVIIQYQSPTGQPFFSGGDSVTNVNGYITHTFTSVGAAAQLTGLTV